MSAQGYQTGVNGEEQAMQYLQAKGMKLVARRYRAGDGEIDLIMREAQFLVFVEVKYRPGGHRGDGILSVTSDKRRRLIHAATLFYSKLHDFTLQPRFDVVEITRDGIFHMADAFRPR